MWAFLALVLGLLGTAESGKRDGLLRSGRRTAASASSTSSAPSTSSRPSSNTNKVAVAVCPDNCSGHGRCTTPIVRTPAEIEGSQGQGGTTALDMMLHAGAGRGSSLPPRCECYQGWSGDNCNTGLADLSMCGGADLKRCSDGQGQCVAKDPPPVDGSTPSYECRCFHPYRGEACEQNLCPDHCSGRGKCHADGCRCIEGWTGPGCATPLCARLNDCSGHGACVLDEGAADYTTGGRCECDAPFTGPDCSSGGCPDDCSGHGVCGLGALCECAPGWTGLTCAEKACGDGCLHGQCVEGDDQSGAAGVADARGLVCLCEDGWRGDSCDLKDCPEPCGAYGDCGSDGTCVCDADWTGRLCEVPLCEKNCSFPNGQCVEQFGKHVCACNPPYQAPLCVHKDCPVDPKSGLVCAAHGVCSDGACICEPGYFGTHCSDRRCPKTPQYVLDHRPSRDPSASSDYAHGGGGVQSMSLFGAPTDPPAPTKRRVLVACSGHGACTAHGNCDCEPGWQGDACDQIKCMHDCHHHGECVPRLAQPGAPGGDELEDDYEAVAADGDPTGAHKHSQRTRKHNADARALDAHETTMPGRCACDAEAGWEGPYCGQKTCPSKAPPAQCSGHGTCLTGACYCQDGYTGEACHVKICPDLGSGTPCNERGMCVDGQCHCLKGYAGTACERPSCPGEGEGEGEGGPDVVRGGKGGRSIPLCGGHGKCQTTETKAEAEKTFAQLMVAYRLESAARKAGNATSAPSMPEPPITAGACICADGWKGLACHQMECPNLCSDNGDCVAATGECACHDGFIGADCSVLECRNGCSGHGVCARVNLTHPMAAANSDPSAAAYSDNDVDRAKFGTSCVCEPGWGGDHGDCAVKVMCVPSAAQSELDDKDSGVRGAEKTPAWRQKSLRVLRDAAATAWRKKKTHVSNTTLVGVDGMKAPQPADPFAQAPFDCGFSLGHGRCVGGTCYCADGWSGKSCAARVCENECSGHGVCGHKDDDDDDDAGPACICADGWKGPSCENIACPRGAVADGTGSGHGAQSPAAGTECSGRGLCYYHNVTSPGRSVVKAAECVCSAGFAGRACELKQCPGDCGDGSGVVVADAAAAAKPFVRRGTCDGSTGTCRCLPGWGGAECKKRECPGEDMPCSGHGACDAATASCACESGWRGDACDASACGGDERGSWNPDKKRCDCGRRERSSSDADAKKKADDMPPLYWGEFCEMTACPGYLEGGSGFAVDGEMAFCSGHGVCNGTRTVKSSSGLDDERLSMGTCKCGAGFTGVDCSVPFGLRPAHEVAREIEELAKERAQGEIDAEKEESRAPGAKPRPGLAPGQGPSVSIIRTRLELQFRAEGVNLAGQVLPAVAKGVARFTGLHSGVVLTTTELHGDIKNDQPGGVAEISGGRDNATVRVEMVKYVDYEDEMAGNSTVVEGLESAPQGNTHDMVYHSECIVDVTISVRTGSASESAFGALDGLSSATHDALIVSKSRADLSAAIVPRQGGVCLQDAMHVLNGPQMNSRELTADEIAEFILMEGEGEAQALNATEKARLATEMEKEEGISMDAAEEAAIDADHHQKAVVDSSGGGGGGGERIAEGESAGSDGGYGEVTYPSVHDSVATVVTQDGISAKGSAALQVEAARVRKQHEREADLETAKMLGGSDEDLHEPLRNEDIGDDVVGAAGTVVGNFFGGGDKMESPVEEEEEKQQQSESGSSGGGGSTSSGSGVGASEQRFAEETMQFFGLRQHRRRR